MGNNTNRRAVVVGGTGLIGGHLLEILGQNQIYGEVISLARREGKKIDGVTWRLADLNDLPEIGPIDDVYCALGTTMKKAGSKEAFRKVDFEYVLSVARWAKKNGAKRFALVSSVGASEQSMAFYLKVKGETENELKKIGYNVTAIFRPSLLLGDRKEQRFGEKFGEILLKLLSPFLIGKLKAQRPVQAENVAKRMVEVITGSDTSGVSVYYPQL